MRVNRQALLEALEPLEAGRTPTDVLEQSSCFAFRGGQVFTFNDDVFCRAPSPLGPKCEGAVCGGPFIELLRKLPEEELDITFSSAEARVKGKGRWSEIRLEKEVHLPVEAVSSPAEWRELDEDFPEAVKLVRSCSSGTVREFNVKAAHVHPDFVEGEDGSQACRWAMKTGVEESTLVRSDSLVKMSALGMTHLGADERWLHFKNEKREQYFSCRRYLEDYRDLTQAYVVEGEEVSLPKGLLKALEITQIFSEEDKNNNQVLLELRAGKVRLSGIGIRGRHTEVKSVVYKGPDMAFYVSPVVLQGMLERHTNFTVSRTKLKAEDGRYVYVASLVDPEALKDMNGGRRRREEEE